MASVKESGGQLTPERMKSENLLIIKNASIMRILSWASWRGEPTQAATFANVTWIPKICRIDANGNCTNK